MSNISEYIQSQPKQTMQAWADRFGVSRSYLTEIIGGKNPSIEVAERIALKTGGAVPVTSWSNHAAVRDAISRTEGLTQGDAA